MEVFGLIGFVLAIFVFVAQMKLFAIDAKLAALLEEQRVANKHSERANWFAEEAMRVSRLDHGIALRSEEDAASS